MRFVFASFVEGLVVYVVAHESISFEMLAKVTTLSYKRAQTFMLHN